MRDLNNNSISQSVGSRRPGHKSVVLGWHQVEWIGTTGYRFLRWRQYPTDISLKVRFVDLMVFVSIEQPRRNGSMMPLDELQTAHVVRYLWKLRPNFMPNQEFFHGDGYLSTRRSFNALSVSFASMYRICPCETRKRRCSSRSNVVKSGKDRVMSIAFESVILSSGIAHLKGSALACNTQRINSMV